jgi:hypothetical protein
VAKLSRWPSDKSLGPRDLLSLWSQVRALWLLIWWSLKAYMVINFRTHGISRSTCKLVRTSMHVKLKKKNTVATDCCAPHFARRLSLSESWHYGWPFVIRDCMGGGEWGTINGVYSFHASNRLDKRVSIFGKKFVLSST